MESHLKKIADLQVCHLIKKTLQYKSFLVKFEEFLGASIFTEHLFFAEHLRLLPQ